MPTYEYRCDKCGERFEITCRMDDRDKLAVCPKCKGKKVTPGHHLVHLRSAQEVVRRRASHREARRLTRWRLYGRERPT